MATSSRYQRAKIYSIITILVTLSASQPLSSNGIDIKILRHHTVSVSNFQSIKVSTDDEVVNI